MIDLRPIRRAPLGVLVLGVLLLFLGAGLIVAPVYLVVTGVEGRRVPGWVAMAATGAVALYLSLALLRMRRWAWTAVSVLLVLLLGSSILRAVGSIEPPGAALAEIAAELLALGYLARPSVRDAFRSAT